MNSCTRFLKLKRSVLILGLIALGSTFAACANEGTKEHKEGKAMPAKTIGEVLSENSNDLLSTSGVVGTGQGLCDNKPCIKVFVTKKTERLMRKIPRVLEGYPVVIEETGKIRTFPQN
jgi:hypothetical protein